MSVFFRNPSVKKIIVVVILVAAAMVAAGCALSDSLSQIWQSTPISTMVADDPIKELATPFLDTLETLAPTVTQEPTFTPTPEGCKEDGGSVQRLQIDSMALGEPLTVSVYLPPCYQRSSRYPVLYLLHGQTMDDLYWLDLGVKQIADQAIVNGQAPFMMVFPFEERNFDPPTESKFYDVVLYDLIPWVDANYATCTERACRAIGGISRGGGWAIRLAVRNFDLFGTFGGHSFGLMYGEGSVVQKQLETHSTDEFPRIYLDRGEKDMLQEDIDYFVGILQGSKIPHEFHIFPGAHNRDYWLAHTADYMNFYMAAWPTLVPTP